MSIDLGNLLKSQLGNVLNNFLTGNGEKQWKAALKPAHWPFPPLWPA